MREGVLGIVFSSSKDQLLLIQRADVPVWALPGGGIDLGETPEAALIREVLEETGLCIELTRKVAEYFPINKLTAVTHVYEGICYSGTPKVSSETRSVAFFPLNKLPPTLFHLHKDWIDDALKREAAVIKAPISQVTYRSLILYFLKHPIRVLRYILSR